MQTELMKGDGLCFFPELLVIKITMLHPQQINEESVSICKVNKTQTCRNSYRNHRRTATTNPPARCFLTTKQICQIGSGLNGFDVEQTVCGSPIVFGILSGSGWYRVVIV
jgi:hypothetical protein